MPERTIRSFIRLCLAGAVALALSGGMFSAAAQEREIKVGYMKNPIQDASLDMMEKWAKEHNRPVYLGEFGAYSAADLASRGHWTAAVAREAEKHGWAWAYWEFGSGFGAYERTSGTWREPLLKALIPNTGR